MSDRFEVYTEWAVRFTFPYSGERMLAEHPTRAGALGHAERLRAGDRERGKPAPDAVVVTRQVTATEWKEVRDV